MLEPTKVEVTSDWRKLRIGQIKDFLFFITYYYGELMTNGEIGGKMTSMVERINLLTYLLTYSMVQSPLREAKRRNA
jgi:hypothetical protein